MPKFKQMPMTPSQVLLFPVSVEESLPKDCDVRVVGEAMDLVDWSAFEAGYSETGCPPYPPKVLAKILVYGYSKGVRSSRALEDAVRNDKRYIWLAGGLEPDHTTIARFRKDRAHELREVYRGSVRICAEAGLVLLDVTATDGSKIKARASKRSLYDARRVGREMEAIERILAEAEEVDRREDELYGSGTGNEIPAELADASKRREKLAEIGRRLWKTGRKNVSVSDTECRVMKTSDGLRPAYNMQVTVDSANLVIVAADVTDSENDFGELSGQLSQVEQNTGSKPGVVLADTGYGNAGTLRELSSSGQEALIPPREQPQQKDMNDLFASRCFLKSQDKDVLICPAGRELTYRGEVRNHGERYLVYTAEGCRSCSFYARCVKVDCKTGRSVQKHAVPGEREEMIRRLRTPEGKKLYSLRQRTVEPVFGNIKANMGLKRFGLHGREGARSETWLVCIAHNLKIYARRRGPSAASALSCVLAQIMGVARLLIGTTRRYPALLTTRACA